MEETLFDPHITSPGDAFYYPPKLYSKIQNVARDITASDFEPTAAQLETAETLTKEVAAQKAKLDAVATTAVAAFNERLKSANVPHIETKPQ